MDRHPLEHCPPQFATHLQPGAPTIVILSLFLSLWLATSFCCLFFVVVFFDCSRCSSGLQQNVWKEYAFFVLVHLVTVEMGVWGVILLNLYTKSWMCWIYKCRGLHRCLPKNCNRQLFHIYLLLPIHDNVPNRMLQIGKLFSFSHSHTHTVIVLQLWTCSFVMPWSSWLQVWVSNLKSFCYKINHCSELIKKM
jgi:hypothetical protein